MAEYEELEKYAVKAFKRHWSGALKKLERTNGSYALKQYHYFEADTEARQLTLAERFYGPSHATKMANLSDGSILKRISCYLPRAIEYALQEYEDDFKEQKDFIKKIVSHEYVIFNSSQCQTVEEYDENWEGLWVAPYPERVAYDDWYERSMGSSCFTGGTFLLMKSTGETFSRTEVEWLRNSIVKNIDENDPYSLWWFECEPLEKNKIWIKIYEFLDRDYYIEDVSYLIADLSKEQLRTLVDKTIGYLSEDVDEDSVPLLELLKIPRTEKAMYNAIQSILEKADDMIVRAVEEMACNVMGLKDRDYHRGQNW